MGAVDGSLLPVPESVPECFPEFVATFAPDCSFASTGVVSASEGPGLLLGSLELGSDFVPGLEPAFTGSDLKFELEPAFTELLLPVSSEPLFCAETEGSTGSATATGSDYPSVDDFVPTLLLPGLLAWTPLFGSLFLIALVGAATGDFKVAAGEGGAFSACGSAARVATGARAVAFCSTVVNRRRPN